MLVKYNGVELPDLPQGVLKDYPYAFIRKTNTNKCYDLSLSNGILYYSSSQNRLIFPSGTAKWFQIPFSATIDENTEWVFNSTYYGENYWVLNSDCTVMWSIFDIPSDSVTSTTIYFAGSPIEYPAIKKYLVRDNDTIYTVTDGALVEVVGDLNAQLFIDNGVDAIPDGTLLMTLSAPEVLCWTDAETLPTLTATVKGIPEPQTVMSKEIDLMHSSIKGINGVTVDCKGDVLFAVSFDKKATWMMHNGTEFIEVSDKLSGMTKTEFEAITAEQWQPKYEASSDMYIRCILFDETQSITTVNVDFIN